MSEICKKSARVRLILMFVILVTTIANATPGDGYPGSQDQVKIAAGSSKKIESANVDGPDEDLYRYNSSSDELNRTVSQLATAYATQRVAVLTLIFAKRIDKVGLFKETFRMIKGEE